MDKQKIESFAKLPLPPQSEWGFIEDIKSPLEYHFDDSRGCDAGENKDCLANGVRIVMEFTGTVPETAFKSLRRVLNAKGIPETDNGYPLIFRDAADFEHEEFELATAPESAVIRAKDTDGIRRGVYALEDQICAAAGKALMPCAMRKKPFVKHRISRCFFGPTYRPPFFIDELTNDIDYYPEEYLNKLAHEGVNGLWLTVYLRDYPTAIMPGHGKDAEKRYAKLKQVAQKCLAYGIRIYLFMSEPKIWGTEYFTLPESDAALHPELIGFHIRKWGFFCTSTDAGKQYFRDTVGGLFSHVPELGGIINIMYGEDNGCCVSSHQIYGETPENEYYSEVIQPYGNLSKKEFLIAKDIMRREVLHMSQLAGVPEKVLLKANWGPRCKVCVDPITGRSRNSNCPSCVGTGFEKPYHGPYDMWMLFSSDSQHQMAENPNTGTTEQKNFTARAIGSVVLRYHDVVIDSRSNKRYYVNNAAIISEVRRIPVIQQLQLSEAAVTDPIYKLFI